MHTELGIKVVDGEPGTLDDAVAELHGIGGVLDRTAGSLSGSAQPPGWQGNASMSYANQCVTQSAAAGAGANAMTMVASHLSTLADALREARKRCREAVRDAHEAKARADRERLAAHKAQTRASAEWQAAATAAHRASITEASGAPATADRHAQQQSETAAAAADREFGQHRRAAQRAEDDFRDAQKRGNRAAQHYEDAAGRAAASIGGLAGSAPRVTSVNGVPVAAVGGIGRPPGVAPLPPPKPPEEPENDDDGGGIGGFIHGALDAAGFIPVIGAAADGANAIYYSVEGDGVNAALSAGAAVPFVGDAAAAGKLVYKGGKAIKAAEEADKGLEAAKDMSRYARPSGFRTGVRDQVWELNREPSTGQVRDPVTGRFMNKEDPWDMGHKPGFEHRKHVPDAARRDIDRNQFLDEYNNPQHYRPELPSSNRSHRAEDKTDNWLGP